MSRIGNSPVKVPDGVTLSHQGNELSAKGSKDRDVISISKIYCIIKYC